MSKELPEKELPETAVQLTGYQGAAAHTFTPGCDGLHPISEQCNLRIATALPAPEIDVNDLPVTAAAAALYRICSGWERDAFRHPWVLGEKDPRAQALQDCAVKLRAAVNDLRRDGDL